VPVLRAFQRLAADRDHPAALSCLVMAGWTEEGSQGLIRALSDLASGIGLVFRCFLRPDEAEKRRIFTAGDVFVSPVDNLQETFGLSILEAMACGLPVVASDFDGYRDLVVHGQTGYLVPTTGPGATPVLDALAPLCFDNHSHLARAQQCVVDVPALAGFLGGLARDPGLRGEMGRAGRRRVERHFSWPGVIERYVALWERLRREPVPDRERLRSLAHPLHIPYGRVFGGHPSGLVDMDLMVTASRAGRAVYRGLDAFVSYEGLGPLLDLETAKRLLFLARSPLSAGELAGGCSASIPTWIGKGPCSASCGRSSRTIWNASRSPDRKRMIADMSPPGILSSGNPSGSPALAKRSLGQNFLIDPNISRKIVAALGIGPQDSVLEIGPGRGALSEWILKACPARYLAVEKDVALAMTLPRNHPGMSVVAADALRLDFRRLSALHRLKIVGNLPYNVASPLVWELCAALRTLSARCSWSSTRWPSAWPPGPGARNMGRSRRFWAILSRWTIFSRSDRWFSGPGPGGFAVVRLTPLDGVPALQDPGELGRLIKHCFSHRRKQMRRTLRGQWSEDVEHLFEIHGYSPESRAEDLTPAFFRILANTLKKPEPLDFGVKMEFISSHSRPYTGHVMIFASFRVGCAKLFHGAERQDIFRFQCSRMAFRRGSEVAFRTRRR
jgi:16S rRNA A1518/A1519 N6-dimethyltransferase RsmA/KsgA/DIM1 with predicted DNA glycosylase/AP lyase activity